MGIQHAYTASFTVWVLLVGCCLVEGAAALGQGQRVTSVYDLPDGRGFVANLEVIEQTELYGPDLKELSMTVR